MTSFMIDELHFSSEEHTTNSIEQGHVWEAYGITGEQKISHIFLTHHHYCVHKHKSLTLRCTVVFPCYRVLK